MVTIFRNRVTAPLIEPTAPPWAQRFAQRLQDYYVPLHPISPLEIFACNQADLPAPSDWPGCILEVVDLQVLAVSRAGQWRRINLGAPI